MSDLQEYLGINVVICDPPTDEEIMSNYADDMLVTVDKEGHKRLNENAFAMAFRDINHLRYNNGLFYTRAGKCTEELLARDVWESLVDINVTSDVERTVRKLIGAVKLASTVGQLHTDPNIIPFSNGDFYIREWEFRADEYTPTAYRLAAPLLLQLQDTPYFLKWLKDLFYPEDIPVIQEYLGYCLVSSTKAQKALFLLGEGGKGKSGLGVILQSILGDAELNIANTQEFLQDKFKLPELEHKLVLYDDDLDSSALQETGLYKKLITNTLSITADRKYGQPFKFTPTIKLVACCNRMLSSVYDNTTGFYRRLLPVVVKPLEKDFVPDLRFYDHLKDEAPGIVQWALLGLQRLIANDWVLSESKRTKDYMTHKQELDNPLPDFMASAFIYGENEPGVSVSEILRVYEVWCRKNSITPQKPKSVQMWIADNAEKYDIEASRTIKDGDKYVRGYLGLSVASAWKSSGKITLI